MKVSLLVFSGLIAGIVCCAAGPAVAGPEQGLLLDENGDRMTGYSAVIVEDDLVYPVCNERENVWYTVNVVGKAADGTILCTIGERMGSIPEGVATDDGGPGEEVEDDKGGAGGPGR